MAEKVSDQVLSRLREWGVEQAFGYAGDGINGLLAAWGRANDQPRFIQARHAHWPSPRPLPGANPAAAGLRRTRLERRPGHLGPGVGVMPGAVSRAEPLDAGGEEAHQDTAELAERLDHSLLGSPGGEEGHGLAQRKRTGA